jgi:two-component system, response regulator, stage 0 sporulation protein F
MSDPIRVMIVDDDDDLREMLVLVLESEGFHTCGAMNGVEALDALQGFTGVVLLDLRMPVMSGWDVIEALRRQGRLGSVPIAICTSSPADAPDGFPILPKPIDLDQMTAIIRSLAP